MSEWILSIARKCVVRNSSGVEGTAKTLRTTLLGSLPAAHERDRILCSQLLCIWEGMGWGERESVCVCMRVHGGEGRQFCVCG